MDHPQPYVAVHVYGEDGVLVDRFDLHRMDKLRVLRRKLDRDVLMDKYTLHIRAYSVHEATRMHELAASGGPIHVYAYAASASCT